MPKLIARAMAVVSLVLILPACGSLPVPTDDVRVTVFTVEQPGCCDE